MKYYDWDIQKNKELKEKRGISFEEVVLAMQSGNLLNTRRNPNQKKYPNQKLFIVNINNYVFVIPFIEDDEKCFLKTIIPSRKETKKYLSKQKIK